MLTFQKTLSTSKFGPTIRSNRRSRLMQERDLAAALAALGLESLF